MLVMEVKVKAMWHTAKYGDPYSECVLCINPSKVHTHFSELNTHTHTVNTPGAVRSHLCCGAWGAVGGLVPCSRAPCCGIGGGRERCTFTPPTYNSCRTETRTCNLSIMSPTLWTIGHDFPLLCDVNIKISWVSNHALGKSVVRSLHSIVQESAQNLSLWKE